MDFQKLINNKRSPLRIGIIGLGKMGILHFNTWRKLPNVVVSALVDINEEKAIFANHYNIPFFSNLENAREYIDMAVIATTASTHFACTLPLLAAGISCMVEKPLTLTIAEAQLLAITATKHHCLLVAGHCERFNPGIQLVQSNMDHRISRIEVKRTTCHTKERCLEIDVLQDLMIHDLDWLILTLGIPNEIRVIQSHFTGGRLEAVQCELRFRCGRLAILESNRLALTRQRTIIMHGKNYKQVYNLDELINNSLPFDPLTLQAKSFLNFLKGQNTQIATSEQTLSVLSCIDRIRKCCLANYVVT